MPVASRSSKSLPIEAYTADAVQKLFTANGSGSQGFHAVGLLADYAEVPEQYEGAIEQFLREELEYIVVESFDHARMGVALLRDEMGGRATFFVDSLNKLNMRMPDSHPEASEPEGVVARLDRLVDFRDPLGPAAKNFLSKLCSAYLVENSSVAERMAHDNVQGYFSPPMASAITAGQCREAARATPDHWRSNASFATMKAKPLRLTKPHSKNRPGSVDSKMPSRSRKHGCQPPMAQHVEAEKSFVTATHQREQTRSEFERLDQRLGAERHEITRFQSEAEAARVRAEQARTRHAEAMRSREAAETGAAEAAEKLAQLRHDFHVFQEALILRREELAAIAERLSSAEAIESRVAGEIAQASDRSFSLRQQHEALSREKRVLETSCAELSLQAEQLRKEKLRLEENKAGFEKEWDDARSRATQIDESVREKRLSLDELRAERGQRQVEKARNDADRDYLRQTCVSELNAPPEDLIAMMAEESELPIGENLIAAETSYNEMKARMEAMGAVNMMALEEFQECEQREQFLRRERDDLVQSIENTQLTINELDQVSRQKFDEAFAFINAHFAIAFQSLFGGGTGEMRLSEPDSSGDAGIDIVAQPPGKRLQNILLLSGGEKALTALALLIGVFRYQPSPFCILDEVDAPLDEANVGRFNKMMADMCGQTQFIVVTHNRKTMEMGSVMYGVTMQEPGVSKLVSVKWEEAEPASHTANAASHAA